MSVSVCEHTCASVCATAAARFGSDGSTWVFRCMGLCACGSRNQL